MFFLNNLHIFLKNNLVFYVFLINENPLKVIKNVFYFILKTLFILKIFKFLS